MNIQFLQSFANTNQWEELKKVLEEYKEIVSNVNDETIVIENATKGELYVGKQFAGKVLEYFIGDVDKYKKRIIPKKQDIDNFN